MIRLTVHTAKRYTVYIGEGLRSICGEYCRGVVKGGKILLLTDSNVDLLYANVVRQSLAEAGFNVYSYVIPAGEASKNTDNLIKIVSFLAQNEFTRADAVIALGGGVVGDLAGFCASAFLRGIGYIQMPTTLLACVDSSVGGKTAVDLPEGKNLFGTFYQPDLVLIDYKTLKTLPDSVYSDGMAEVIKYGMICDADFFAALENRSAGIENIISRCITLKSDIVSKDEKEEGYRRILNFGHTIGHAVEKASNFGYTHGSAVAVGMAIMTRALAVKGMLPSIVATRLENVLKTYGLPVDCNISSNDIYAAALTDKKRIGDNLNLVTVTDIGKSEILNIPITLLKSYIEDGRAKWTRL